MSWSARQQVLKFRETEFQIQRLNKWMSKKASMARRKSSPLLTLATQTENQDFPNRVHFGEVFRYEITDDENNNPVKTEEEEVALDKESSSTIGLNDRENELMREFYRGEFPMLEAREEALSRRRAVQQPDIDEAPEEPVKLKGNLKIIGEPLDDVLLNKSSQNAEIVKKRVTIFTPSEELIAAGGIKNLPDISATTQIFLDRRRQLMDPSNYPENIDLKPKHLLNHARNSIELLRSANTVAQMVKKRPKMKPQRRGRLFTHEEDKIVCKKTSSELLHQVNQSGLKAMQTIATNEIEKEIESFKSIFRGRHDFKQSGPSSTYNLSPTSAYGMQILKQLESLQQENMAIARELGQEKECGGKTAKQNGKIIRKKPKAGQLTTSIEKERHLKNTRMEIAGAVPLSCKVDAASTIFYLSSYGKYNPHVKGNKSITDTMNDLRLRRGPSKRY